MLNISEIFLSIQGETSFIGLPTIFIRLAGCNLRCNYCDTIYAYQSNIYKTIKEIVKEIKRFKSIKYVTITGGEPLLQKEIYSLFNYLMRQKYKIILETNGSISVEKVPQEIIKIIDFKTPSSQMSKNNYWKNIDYLNKDDEIKFVLQNYSDFNWAVEKIQKYKLISDVKVLFSSVRKELPYNRLANWILKNRLNVRLQPQLHKILNIK